MAHPTLSSRGNDIVNFPGGFNPPAVSNRYDAETNPTGVISFATAENLLVHDEIANYINNLPAISPHPLTYRHNTAGGPKYLNASSQFFNQHFHPLRPITPENLIGTAGVTAISEMLAFGTANPGDGILVPRPIYSRFENDFGVKAGVKVIYVSMGRDVDPLGVGAVEAYERAMVDAEREGVRVRGLMVCNPHNPLGRCYSVESLKAHLAFCGKHKIHYFSDELYGMSVYESGEPGAEPFTSVLSLDKDGLIGEEYVHVMYGMAKDFGSAGLRLGVLQSFNDDLLKACRAMARFHGVSGLSTAAASAILSDSTFITSFLETSRARLASSFRYTVSFLDEMGIKYHRGVNAGFFLLINLEPFLPPPSSSQYPTTIAATTGPQGNDRDMIDREREREKTLSDKLLNAHGVFLAPREEKAESVGWYRLVFTLNRSELEEGLRRLKIGLEKSW